MADAPNEPVQHVPALPSGRPETGVMQFGDDWPGVFIRGDHAFYFAISLKQVIEQLPDDAWLQRSVLSRLADTLAASRVDPKSSKQRSTLP